MTDMEMSDLLNIFLEEAEEQLQRLDDGILQLEKQPDDSEVLKEVFRAAHTLKGSSATMGFTELANLTHAMENLLDNLRNGAAKATPETVDLLLASIDALRTLVEQVSQGEKADLDTTELVQQLKAACQAQADDPTNKASAVEPTNADCVSSDPNLLTLKLKMSEDCLMPSVRAFMIYNAISSLGTVVSADPPQDQLDAIQAGQMVVIAFEPSQGVEPVIAALNGLSEVDLIEYNSPGQPEQKTVKEKPEVSVPASEQKSPAATGEHNAKAMQTVRVSVDRLDTLMNLVAELVIDRTRVSQIESEMSLKYESDELVQNLGETAVHIGRVVSELQEHIMKVRLLPVEQVFNRFPRMVRDLSRRAGKDIELVLVGQETELDRSILEDLVDPLTHLLRNSVDHGIESPEERKAAGKAAKAQVTLAAKQEENRIIIEVEDDGKGISLDKVKSAALKKGVVSEEMLSRMSDEDALQLIFASGVSTAEKITDISGRGVGMDVVRNNIQGLSGNIEVFTEPGHGSKFKISLPLTLAIIQSLVTGVGDQVFVIPLSAVAETFRCDTNEIRYIDGSPAINFRGSVLPLMNLGMVFGSIRQWDLSTTESVTFVVVNTGALKVGLVVDRLIGEQEVVIKSLGSFLGNMQGIAGATILGDGRVALIVDVAGLGGLLSKKSSDHRILKAGV